MCFSYGADYWPLPGLPSSHHFFSEWPFKSSGHRGWESTLPVLLSDGVFCIAHHGVVTLSFLLSFMAIHGFKYLTCASQVLYRWTKPVASCCWLPLWNWHGFVLKHRNVTRIDSPWRPVRCIWSLRNQFSKCSETCWRHQRLGVGMGDIHSATLSQGANSLTSKMASDRCAVGCFIVSIMFPSQERHIGPAEIAWHLQAQAHVSA